MFLLKKIIQIYFLISFALAQGPTNSFGIGNLQKWSSPSQSGVGSIGLVPSFQNNVSLLNPVTWPNLKYTHLSVSYNGLESKIVKNNATNSFSNLQSAQLIVPIKNRYAIGLALHPYSYQQIVISDTGYSDRLAFEDTLTFDKRYDQSGGIMALDLSLASALFNGNRIGFTLQLLFGSSRQNKSLIINQIPYTQTSRLNYSGINSTVFIIQKMNFANFYLNASFSIKPLEAIYTKLYPFDDTNNNGYHDFTYNYLNPGYDFPHPDDIPGPIESRLDDIYDRSSIGMGMAKKILNRMQLSAELQKNKDNSSFNALLPNSFNYRIKSNNHYSLGIIWFPDDLSFRFFDNFTFRSGFVYSDFSFDEYENISQSRIDNKNDITQLGYTIGFGYKFKAVGNQIDFSYYSGSRDYPNIYSDEKLREFHVGISIADIWFIKRRQR